MSSGKKRRDNVTDEARAAAREYKRKWREKNKDKIKSYNDAYWQKKAEQMQKDDGKNDKKI